MLRIKRNDQVVVIAGKDKGKAGRVLKLVPEQNRIIVEHVNMIKKAQKKSQQNPQGGFVELEASIHYSNVMLLDKKTNKPTRFSASILKDGTKVRISKKSGEVI